MSEDCIFCGTMKDLNTVMMIPIVGGQAQVKICDAHSLNATIRSIKKAYDQKNVTNKKLTKLQKEALALGYVLVPKGRQQQQLIQSTQQLIQLPAQPAQPAQQIKKLNLPPILTATQGEGAPVPQSEQGQFDLSEGINKGITNEVVDAETIQSQTRRITIPKKMVGNIGETTIRVINTNGTIKHGGSVVVDKQYANKQMHDCVVCKGMGALSNGANCPRCNGSGVV